VASTWITKRTRCNGRVSHRVEFHLGGSGARTRYAGSFRTRREAEIRRNWVAGELAALRVPDISRLREPPEVTKRVSVAAADWFETRIDVADSTKTRHGLELERIKRLLGHRPVTAVAWTDVQAFIGALVEEEYARGTIRKTVQTLAMVFDHAEVNPNPARDKRVKLPHSEEEDTVPPTAEHLEAIFWLMPKAHRLPFLWLDWSGLRVGALDKTLVGDYDELNRRVLLRKSTTKTRTALWNELPPALAKAIEATLPPREDRDLSAKLFAESNSAAFRTAMAKACKHAGVPLYSPHDLRHRRISLLAGRAIPLAEIAEFVGQRSIGVTWETYTHVMLDKRELDYTRLLAESA
jgi:integrase